LDLVEQGAEVVITRHGKVVARLVPPGTVINRDEARAAMARLRARAKALKLGITLEEALAWRNEGRR
jgi:antitoxin (DNA-binding transcriptional repressor) of toxin-antitoxin stability system